MLESTRNSSTFILSDATLDYVLDKQKVRGPKFKGYVIFCKMCTRPFYVRPSFQGHRFCSHACQQSDPDMKRMAGTYNGKRKNLQNT